MICNVWFPTHPVAGDGMSESHPLSLILTERYHWQGCRVTPGTAGRGCLIAIWIGVGYREMLVPFFFSISESGERVSENSLESFYHLRELTCWHFLTALI